MTDLKQHQLVYVPHPCLTTAVEPLDVDDADYVVNLKNHMIDVMEKHHGLGLAANQINLNATVFTMKSDGKDLFVINPAIHELSDETVLMTEGCLSDPGMYLKIKRPSAVRASWEEIDGSRTTHELYGLSARVFLHEYDHLCGVLFTDRVGRVKLEAARKKQKKMIR